MDSPSAPCSFTGDDNTYGLGIRTGIYLQWLTSVIAFTTGPPGEIESIRGANNAFQIAMLAGLMYTTVSRLPYAAEIYIELLLCMGGICASAGFPRTELAAGATTAGDLLRLILTTSICAYGCWFTFAGMDQHMTPPPPSCHVYIFFFSRLDLYGKFRTFLKAVFSIGLFFSVLLLIENVVYLWQRFRSWYKTDWRSLPRRNTELGSVKEEGWRKILPPLCTIISGCLFALSVELTLQWNTIDSVHSWGSTGQIFPLVAALCTFLRLLFKLVRGYWVCE